MRGNTATQQIKNRNCDTAVSRAHWESQLEGRPVARFGVFLDFHKPAYSNLAAVTTPSSSRFFFLPPPAPWLAPWLHQSLRFLGSLHMYRSSFCYLILVRNEEAFRVLLCRFLDPFRPLTTSLRCPRPVLRVGGQVDSDRSCWIQPIQSCSCPREYPFHPSTCPNITNGLSR